MIDCLRAMPESWPSLPPAIEQGPPEQAPTEDLVIRVAQALQRKGLVWNHFGRRRASGHGTVAIKDHDTSFLLRFLDEHE